MKKLILGLAAASAVAVAAPGLASADVSDNGTTNDAYGFCVANHIAQATTAPTTASGGSAPARPASRSPPKLATAPRTASTPESVRLDQQQRLTYHITCAPGSRSRGRRSERANPMRTAPLPLSKRTIE